MVSEDSDELVPGLLSVHGLHHADDLRQSLAGQVVTAAHEFHAMRELFEVVPLRRPQGLLPEERNNPSEQILAAGHGVAIQVLAVVV